MLDRLNDLNLGALYLLAIAFAAVCFAIGAGLGWLANRRRQR